MNYISSIYKWQSHLWISLSLLTIPAAGIASRIDPEKLPEIEKDTVSVCSELCNNELSFNIDSLTRLPHNRLTEESLPSGYGYTVFSSAPVKSGEDWWSSFKDPALDRLEALALNNNYNLRAMLKRIEASRQILRGTLAGYYPTVSINAGYEWTKDSGKESKPYSQPPFYGFFRMGASVSWEIDVFGRIYEKAKANKADIKASRLEFEAMQLSLEAEVANQYATLRMCEQQLDVAMTHLNTQEEILTIAEARYKAGLVSKLDVAQAQSMVSSTRLLIPQYRAQAASARNALATLCGVRNTDITAMIKSGDMPHLTAPMQVGVPADLIRRRPDVAEAEMEIEVLAAQLGVAKKDYLPTLSLNAEIYSSADSFNHLFESSSMNYDIYPTLTWTLFDGFARKAGIAQAKADMEAQIDTYNMTLLTALQEAEDAMQNYVAAGRELTLYADVLENSREVVDLSLERYRHGLTDFTDVANAQITYLQNHTNYQTSRANMFSCIVNLYKAIGGGFNGLIDE